MHFGLRYANLGPYTAGPAAIEIAQAAEAAGFESIWTIEHVVVPGCTLGHGLGPDVPVSYTRADFVTGQDPYVAALDMVW